MAERGFVGDQLAAGATFPTLRAQTILGATVEIPNSRRWVHLQFRRFAVCPVCNLHLQSFVARHDEIAAAGVLEVVVFHSTKDELLPHQGRLPFDVIGDPRKALYRRYGVSASVLALLRPGSWGAMMRGLFVKGRPRLSLTPTGGLFGHPADFLVAPGGRIVAVHYGAHADDQWSVDAVLALVQTAVDSGRPGGGEE